MLAMILDVATHRCVDLNRVLEFRAMWTFMKWFLRAGCGASARPCIEFVAEYFTLVLGVVG